MPGILVAVLDGTVPAVLVGILIGLIVGAVILWMATSALRRNVREEAQKAVELGRREGEITRQELLNQGRVEIEQLRTEMEREAARRELKTEAQLDGIRSREDFIGQQDREISAQEQRIEREKAAVQQARDAVRSMSRDLRKTMENLSGMDIEQVRANLREEVSHECEEELRRLRREVLERSEREVERDARRILVAAMQRLTNQPLNDLTATIVQLPGDDMKGRIIGREGRNIKSFEAATGTTLLIDESPQMVLISSFDPVRRQIARMALERLVADGRIHPASIEEVVSQARSEVDGIVRGAADEAIAKLRISAVHPEVVQLLGKLKFRFSYTQNVLDHSVEVALLSSMIASELGLDPVPAKRAGLFHDIGKSIDGEYEGSHAKIGAELIKRYGEDAVVVNAVAAHHEEVKPESTYAGIIMLADTISAIRPGARAESLTAYIERLDRLEKLALAMDGVKSVYAVHAGREIRVLVSPEEIDDARASALARELRRKIEDELQYPSTIKVTVIRESRYTETAT